MKTKSFAATLVNLALLFTASSPRAGTMEGSVKMGGVIFRETGDQSTVQETYNVYDGFAVSQIRLDGTLKPGNYVALNLEDINLDSRKGSFDYRVPGCFKLSGDFDQSRQVFDPVRLVASKRKDWKVGAQYTPSRWFALSGYFNYLTRNGDRLSYPTGTPSVLGTQYDNSLKSGQATAEYHKDRRGVAISYSLSDYNDGINDATGRTGQVVSARMYAPTPFYEKWTNLLRAAYGERKLSNNDLDYTLANFQYTGVVQPSEDYQIKYNFDANRIDNKSTRLETDRFQNSLDATYFYKYGRFNGGYAYEINDDNRTLTSYDSWRVGTAFHYLKYVNAKVDYASRVKKDEEDLTLLKSVEASQIRAKLDLQPRDNVVFGGGYTKRQRELPDIGVKADGDIVNAFGRYDYKGWGSASAEYSLSTDEYRDLAGKFDSDSHIVTGRIEFNRIKNLRLAGGATYLDIGRDLDIEKSMLFAEGSFKVLNDYHLEVRYNVYNYDDYILLDRYYTANVVRINLAYDLHL